VRPRGRLRAGMASRARSPGNAGHPHLPLRRPSWNRMRSGQDRPSESAPCPPPSNDYAARFRTVQLALVSAL
jgi:hypothetical protein